MALEQILTDSFAHAGVGVALALADFLTHKLTNPTAQRVTQKARCLQAMECLLDSAAPQISAASAGQPPAETESGTESSPQPVFAPQKIIISQDSVEYAEQIAIVREYLRATGLVKFQLPAVERVKNGMKHLLLDEKLNNLSTPIKLGIAAGVEIVYDVIFDFRVQGAGGIATTLYQIPAFWAGLWLGNGVKKIINLFLISKDERRLEKTIQQLIHDTPIVDLVVRYEPPEQVQQELNSRGIQVYVSQLTRTGQGMYKRLQHLAESAKSTADGVIHFSQKQQEKEQQERDERKKRFDDLTKGR